MTDPSPSTVQLVVFALSAEHYALPIAAVSEIIRYTRPRSIASDVAWSRGVISLRGKIIPIFDLAARLNIPSSPEAETDKIVIVETATGHTGVTVDEVDEVITVSSEQLEPLADAGDGLEGILKLGDRLVILLDPVTLLTDTQPDPALAAA